MHVVGGIGGQKHAQSTNLLGHAPAAAGNAVEDLLSRGDDQTLMEQVVSTCNQARAALNADVVVVEGMVPEAGMVYATRVNALMLKALDAELVLVGTPRDQSPTQVADAVAAVFADDREALFLHERLDRVTEVAESGAGPDRANAGNRRGSPGNRATCPGKMTSAPKCGARPARPRRA